jgi:hypothetical protein
MNPLLLVSVLVVVLMAKRLTDIYLGGHYMCPSCGARDERRHSTRLSLEPPTLGVKVGRRLR